MESSHSHMFSMSINFVVFLTTLVFLFKKMIKNVFAKRHDVFSTELKLADEELIKAEYRYDSSMKLYILANDDATTIEKSMTHQADLLAEKIIVDTAEESKRIIEAARIYGKSLREDILNKTKKEVLLSIASIAKTKCKDIAHRDKDLAKTIMMNSAKKAAKAIGEYK